MKKIYYMGYYDSFDHKEQNRNFELAAQTKMSYIISALEKSDYSVEVVSPVVSADNRFCKRKVMPVGKQSRLHLFDAWPRKPRLLRVIGRYITDFQVFFYLLRNLKKTDTLILYHGLAQMKKIQWLKKHINFRLIMEIEEIYGNVTVDEALTKRELVYFRLADGYIFPAKRLNEKVNVEKKPYVLIHGTYRAEEERTDRMEDGKIHCVYAGTLDPNKGGAVMAANAVRYLPEKYHLHILGFGATPDIENMKKLVAELSDCCNAGISYDGCLQGEEYTTFLQRCHIGLSTQNPQAAFNDTSFPSKILSYMANGVEVVTVRIPVVEESAVAEHLHFYDQPTPEAIAQAIASVDLTGKGQNGRAALTRLDQVFIKDIKTLLETPEI